VRGKIKPRHHVLLPKRIGGQWNMRSSRSRGYEGIYKDDQGANAFESVIFGLCDIAQLEFAGQRCGADKD
jgi:hypothetical protein